MCPGWNPPVLLYVVLMIPHVHFDPFCACKCGKAIPTSKLSLMVTLPTITTKYGLEWPSKTKQGLNHNQGIKATLWPALSPPTARGQRVQKRRAKRPCILHPKTTKCTTRLPRTSHAESLWTFASLWMWEPSVQLEAMIILVLV